MADKKITDFAPYVPNTQKITGDQIRGNFDYKTIIDGVEVDVKPNPEKRTTLSNGNFTVSESVATGALYVADQLLTEQAAGNINLATDEFWKGAAEVTDGNITREGLAAYALARSVAGEPMIFPPTEVVSGSLGFHYDGTLDAKDYKADPKLVGVLAKEFYNDNGLINGEGNGNSERQNKKFTKEASDIIGIIDPTTLPATGWAPGVKSL